jgi:hypothetical protein
MASRLDRISQLATVLVAALCIVSCGQRDHGLPLVLGGLPLTRVVDGDEARKAVDALHGVPVPAVSHAIATYGDVGDATTLYVSRFPDPEAARRDLMRMAMKLANGNAVFTPVEVGEMGSAARFRTLGLGLEHLFFRRGSLVLWLQSPPDHAASVQADLEAADLDRLLR